MTWRMAYLLHILVSVVLLQVQDVYGFPRAPDAFKYLPQLQESVFSMLDTDDSGAISFSEAQTFLSTPNVPQPLQHALMEDDLDTADTNSNGQLERYEVQIMLAKILRDSTYPISNLLQIVALEVQLLINRGEIVVPSTPEDIADTVLDILDTNSDRELDIEEARAFYSVISTERFWDDLVLTATAVDSDGDKKLNKDEIIAMYNVLESKYGTLTVTPLMIYGGIKERLGEFPTPEI